MYKKSIKSNNINSKEQTEYFQYLMEFTQT